MTAAGAAELRIRLEQLLTQSGVPGEIVEGASLPGAGSVPGEVIPTPVLAIADAVDARWRRLLDAPTPILARRNEGTLFIDLRAVDRHDDDAMAAALS